MTLSLLTPVTAVWVWVLRGVTGRELIATIVTLLTLLLAGAVLYGRAVADNTRH